MKKSQRLGFGVIIKGRSERTSEFDNYLVKNYWLFILAAFEKINLNYFNMGYVGDSQIKIPKAHCAVTWRAVCQKTDCFQSMGSRNRKWDHLSPLKNFARELERVLPLAHISGGLENQRGSTPLLPVGGLARSRLELFQLSYG